MSKNLYPISKPKYKKNTALIGMFYSDKFPIIVPILVGDPFTTKDGWFYYFDKGFVGIFLKGLLVNAKKTHDAEEKWDMLDKHKRLEKILNETEVISEEDLYPSFDELRATTAATIKTLAYTMSEE